MPEMKVTEMMCVASRHKFQRRSNFVWVPISPFSAIFRLVGCPPLSNALSHSGSSRISVVEELRGSNSSRRRG